MAIGSCWATRARWSGAQRRGERGTETLFQVVPKAFRNARQAVRRRRTRGGAQWREPACPHGPAVAPSVASVTMAASDGNTTVTTVERPSLRVYLDQNILSPMAMHPGGWQASEIGHELAQFGRANVWITPAHVVELLLHPNSAQRCTLANAMLDLSDATRMGPDYAYEVMDGFLAYVERACPGAMLSREYLDHARETDCQLFLGALALLACGREPSGAIVRSVTRLKLANRWLRARAGTAPDDWLRRVREGAQQLVLAHPDSNADVAEMSERDLARMIRDAEERAVRLRPEQRRALKRDEDSVVRAYSVADTMDAFNVVFGRLPGDVSLTLNFALLEQNWSRIQRVFKCQELPTSAGESKEGWIVNELIRGLWHVPHPVAAADIAQRVLLEHYLDRLNERGADREERLRQERQGGEHGKLPVDGLTFDADHASFALRRAHVFVTRDRLLHDICRKFVNVRGAQLGWSCRVVSDARGLGEALTESG